MTRFRWALLLGLFPPCALAQPKEALVVFKDGFHVKGKVVEKRDFVTDPISGQSFTIPAGNGFLYVDDNARRLFFSPTQVAEVVPLKPEEIPQWITIKRPGSTRRGDAILPGWIFEKVTDWNDQWERTVTVYVTQNMRRFNMTQRITRLTPYDMQVLTLGYEWDVSYLTKELGPFNVRELLAKYYRNKGDLKEGQIAVEIAKFLQQAGWYEYAERELVDVADDAAGDADTVKNLRKQLREQKADWFAGEIEQAAAAGRHGDVRKSLDFFDKADLGPLLPEKRRLAIHEIKLKAERAATQLEQARVFLKDIPPLAQNSAVWKDACALIVDELNLDTLPRLDAFLGFADQYLADVKMNRMPTQSADEVLALAVTGWLQGGQAADPDVKLAARLVKARLMAMDYLRAESPVARAELLRAYRSDEVPLDVLMRLLRLMPPTYPEPNVGETPLELKIETPNASMGSYVVQVPPGYSHHRSYPVLMLLQSPRDRPKDLVARWTAEAARHGFVLVAPVWADAPTAKYQYTGPEHALVLDVLRDVRRRFNVDSDRVFLFGWEQGASMAFDIGLSHPDEFAGVAPMNGSVALYPSRYATNAQYLPFYIVEGDRNGGNAKATRTLFKDWIRNHYASVYVEYKGRASEWYFQEIPAILSWMSKKKRSHPQRELGRYHTGGGVGEEFKTTRTSDNRFYWLGAGAINERNLNDAANWVHTILPATLQATVSTGNEAGRIWNQVSVRTNGIKQLSIWLAPGMVDFGKQIVVRVNGVQMGAPRIISPSLEFMLNDLGVTGDRQRLYVGRIDLKL